MVAGLERCVGGGCGLDGAFQAQLKRPDAFRRGHPAPGHGRLYDDKFDLGGPVEHPRGLRRPHGCGGVEHQLLVFLGIHRHAIAKLPVQHHGLGADAAQEVGAAERIRQPLAEIDRGLDGELHLLVRVDDIQRRQRREDLLVQHVLVQHMLGVGRAHQRVRRHVLVEHLADDVVQERPLVGVGAGGRGRHLGDQRHATRTVDHALGGRAADNCRVFHSPSSIAWSRTMSESCRWSRSIFSMRMRSRSMRFSNPCV